MCPPFQVATHDADQIIRSFFRRRGVSRHKAANAVLHEFGHDTVEGSPLSREPLENACALFAILKGAQNGLQLCLITRYSTNGIKRARGRLHS